MKRPTIIPLTCLRSRRQPLTLGGRARLWLAGALSVALWLAPSGKLIAQATIGNGATMEILGVGTESLIGGDLTDPENDGDELAGPDDPSWNWKSIDSNNEPGFDGAENSFNVFDNKLGPSNDKWCCDDATEDAPKNITVEFDQPIRLTHFTVSSANDTPARDPQDWKIQGSNDGITFTDIFVQSDDESQWGITRLQVNKFTLDVPAAPYTFIRFECTRTADTLYQVGEIEYFGLLGIGQPVITLLGTGTGALLGGDLTDPDNNGDEAAGPTDPSWNWASITSNNEPGFGGAEFSFNIFDNKVGEGGDKWCCDDPSEANPLWVDVDFGQPVVLKYFTIASGNDARDREPIKWQIQGSNDGTTYAPIYAQDAPTSIWTDVNQVARVDLAAPASPYQHIRYIVFNTPGPLHQLNEIEYFGDRGGVSKPSLSGRKVGKDFVQFNITDGADTTLDDSSVVIKLDGNVVATTMSNAGAVTSFVHKPSPLLVPGSDHTYEITAKDNFANPLLFVGGFRQPVPWFPEADLPGPAPVEGLWATRYIFNAGTLDSIPSVLAVIQAAPTAEFTGAFVDVTSEVLNHNAGGYFTNPLPYADEAMALGCCGDDFTLLSIGHIRITEEADYTFGVHSDDGFALRIRGGTAISVSGNGELDAGDPEAVVHPANTGDSSTRGVYHLKPGIYRIEFFWWERGGGDFGELYAAKGAFANDADTDTWKLVGLVSPAQTFTKLGVDSSGWSVVSSDPGGDPLNSWAEALLDLEGTAGPPTVYDVMNVGDPDTNGGTLPFPKDAAGDQDDYAIIGTAKLVVPKNGTYMIGFNSDDGAYVKIAGQTFTQILVNGTGFSVIDPSADQVTCDCLTGDSNTQAEVVLAAGMYDIEVGMFERAGGAFLAVKGVESGSPLLPLLAKDGAGDLFVPAGGIGLTDDPVTTGPASPGVISSVQFTSTNTVITYQPASPTATVKLAQSLDLKTWVVTADVPVISGSSLVFTVAHGAEPEIFYRVIEQ